ncbi:MAG: PLP-dependent aminotransferase family protein [Alphaproteobacteria bacterium]|jgi:2-aminoadipate transaminase|nr:PLP-dependent aminotransferase family protein [Alphaproteobacteria bacterium]MBT6183100.1 PLP-dependent aminotransferase family protein [archaeon]
MEHSKVERSKYNHLLAKWTQNIQPSAMQNSLQRTSDDLISFALGLPDTSLFPFHKYKESIIKTLNSSHDILQYTPPLRALKKHIVTLMKMRQVTCNESQIFITNGAQQGLNLLSRLLLNSGDKIVVEDFTYPGFLQAVTPLSPKLLIVPTNHKTGIDLDILESTLKTHKSIKFLYTICDGHNPLGISLDNKSRKRLADLASTYKTFIIEDDPYGFLYYDKITRPIRSFNPEYACYVGTFSKILAPSFRLGWIVLPEELVPKLAILKESTDINMATFTQHVTLNILERGVLIDNLSSIREEYKKRRNVMLKTVSDFFPSGTEVITPTHGFFMWLKLPIGYDTSKLFDHALDKAKVAFIPGHAFTPRPNEISKHCMRLNFSYNSPSIIQEGIERLGNMLEKTSLKVI